MVLMLWSDQPASDLYSQISAEEAKNSAFTVL